MKVCTRCGAEGHLPKDCPMVERIVSNPQYTSLLTSYEEYVMMFLKRSSLDGLI